MIEIIYLLLTTHLTIICVTLYLHRGEAHRGVIFNPVVAHFMRFWLWLTTGMTTKQWVAIHRKHHQVTDQEEDPHSPHVFGIHKVLWSGWYLYNRAAKDANFIVKYGKGTPRDWIEKNLYTPHHSLGIVFLLTLDVFLFGLWGIAIWIVQMIWIPFFAAGVINGLAHWVGYRNGETKDHSHNIFPFGILIGGEELHNSHHLDPANPKFSRRWFEFDIGWMYLQILFMLKLAKLRQT